MDPFLRTCVEMKTWKNFCPDWPSSLMCGCGHIQAQLGVFVVGDLQARMQTLEAASIPKQRSLPDRSVMLGNVSYGASSASFR